MDTQILVLCKTLEWLWQMHKTRGKNDTHWDMKKGRPSSHSPADLPCPIGQDNEGDRKGIANMVRWLWSGPAVLEISTNIGWSPWVGVNTEWGSVGLRNTVQQHPAMSLNSWVSGKWPWEWKTAPREILFVSYGCKVTSPPPSRSRGREIWTV